MSSSLPFRDGLSGLDGSPLDQVIAGGRQRAQGTGAIRVRVCKAQGLQPAGRSGSGCWRQKAQSPDAIRVRVWEAESLESWGDQGQSVGSRGPRVQGRSEAGCRRLRG
jgi:hypothetical protein